MAYNIFVTRQIPEVGVEMLRPHCDRLDVGPGDRPITEVELAEGVRGRDGVLCSIGQRIDEQVLSAAGKKCRVFANYGVGTDHIDVVAAARLGIVVTNTPGVLTDATADLTWALLMSTARRVVEGDRLARSGEWAGWDPMQLRGLDVAGATLGVIGAGRIGTAVGQRSVGFRMKVLYVDDRDVPELDAIGGRRVALDICLAQSDFVSLHTPLTEQTHHLIGAAELRKMKRTAVLINTARGPVVDEGALIEALRTGLIAGAGLDVYEQEPKIPAELAALDNVVCLPHLGSATHSTRARMAEMAASDLLAVLRGEPPQNPVGP
jgi:glyoxylate reductase